MSTNNATTTTTPTQPTIPEDRPLDTHDTTTSSSPRGRQSVASSSVRKPDSSRSPSATRSSSTSGAGGLKNKMTGLVDKIKGAVSREPSRDRGAGEERGRAAHHGHGDAANGEYKIATGRGGAGNMLRSKSPPGSRDRAKHGGGVVTVEEERAASRERARSRERPHAAGRGGAGNIRSPSRDPAHEAQVKALDKEEHQVEAKHEKDLKDHPAPQPVGRGGAGNIH